MPRKAAPDIDNLPQQYERLVDAITPADRLHEIAAMVPEADRKEFLGIFAKGECSEAFSERLLSEPVLADAFSRTLDIVLPQQQ